MFLITIMKDCGMLRVCLANWKKFQSGGNGKLKKPTTMRLPIKMS